MNLKRRVFQQTFWLVACLLLVMTSSAHAQQLNASFFTPSPTVGVPPMDVQFNADASTGTITNYFWDFGDGTTTNVPGYVVDHIYQGAGTFTVKLIVSGAGGTATNTQVDFITTGLVPPTAFFDVSQQIGAPPLEVQFSTFFSTGSISNYFWDFG